MSKCVLVIHRAERFCPKGAAVDVAIMEAVVKEAQAQGAEVTVAWEDNFPRGFDELAELRFDAIIHQCRSKEALRWLMDYEARHNVRIMNRPQSVLNNTRAALASTLLHLSLPTPESIIAQHPELQGQGYWIKASDTADSSEGHIRFISAECRVQSAEFAESAECRVQSASLVQSAECRVQSASAQPNSALCTLNSALPKGFIVQPHIPGELVKFYGVGDKIIFPHEVQPNSALCTLHSAQPNSALCTLHSALQRLSSAMRMDIYGGDAILTPQGEYCIIDFNDFPSFAPCRDIAAKEIISFLIL